MERLETNIELSEALKREANKHGFHPVGIAKIPGSSRLQLRTASLQRWLGAGYQSDMNWMSAPRRQNIETLLEGASSLLAVGLNYYVNAKKSSEALSIARYAWGNDYHVVVEKRLKQIGHWLKKQRPDCQWKVCVDSAPLLDKAWAEEAGLGWIGKHSNIINEKKGSWMVLGHLLCTEPLIPDQPSKAKCGQCQKCIEACPTKAIVEPFVVNSNKCLAYHTIENRNEEFPKEINQSIGKWIAGCDICQDVCPWNQKELTNNSDPEVQPKDWVMKITKEEALSWSDEKWIENLRGTSLRRIKPWMWRRNAKAINSEN